MKGLKGIPRGSLSEFKSSEYVSMGFYRVFKRGFFRGFKRGFKLTKMGF